MELAASETLTVAEYVAAVAVAGEVSASVADPAAPGATLNVEGDSVPVQPEGTTLASEKLLALQ